jgi:hypothetical protein
MQYKIKQNSVPSCIRCSFAKTKQIVASGAQTRAESEGNRSSPYPAAIQCWPPSASNSKMRRARRRRHWRRRCRSRQSRRGRANGSLEPGRLGKRSFDGWMDSHAASPRHTQSATAAVPTAAAIHSKPAAAGHTPNRKRQPSHHHASI